MASTSVSPSPASSSAPPSTTPSTPPSPANLQFKTIIYYPALHPLPQLHLTALRDLINPAYSSRELNTFTISRIPDEEAIEISTPGRWVLCLYAPSASSPLPITVTDHVGVTHDLSGLALVGTVSISRHKLGTVEGGPAAFRGDGKEELVEGTGEWHIHLLAASVEMPRAGLGARALQAAADFVAHTGEAVVAYSIVEFGNVDYYERRGFVEVEGARIQMKAGSWDCTQPFTLARMVKA